MRIKKAWALYFVSPVASFFYSGYRLFSGRVGELPVFAISLALIYMYMPIMWDVKHNFYRVMLRPEDGLNVYTFVLYGASYWLGLSFMAGVYAFTLASFFGLVWVFAKHLDDVSRSRGALYYLTCLLLVLAMFEYRVSLDLQRTSIAVCLFLVGLNCESRARNLAFIALSALVHQFVLIGVLFWFFSRLVPWSLHRFLFASMLTASTVFGYDISRGFLQFSGVVPDVVVNYLTSEVARFSSEGVALLVRYLRLASVALIFLVFSSLARTLVPGFRGSGSDEGWRIRILLGMCFACVVFGSNDVFLERLYFMAAALASYLLLRYRPDFKKVFVAGAPILLNVAVLGLNTIGVVFSDGYSDVVGGAAKMLVFSRLFYLPTFFLSWIGYFGQSDSFVFVNAPEL